jgi:hypothetical protein
MLILQHSISSIFCNVVKFYLKFVSLFAKQFTSSPNLHDLNTEEQDQTLPVEAFITLWAALR